MDVNISGEHTAQIFRLELLSGTWRQRRQFVLAFTCTGVSVLLSCTIVIQTERRFELLYIWQNFIHVS